jgi:hypothetical protein
MKPARIERRIPSDARALSSPTLRKQLWAQQERARVAFDKQMRREVAALAQRPAIEAAAAVPSWRADLTTDAALARRVKKQGVRKKPAERRAPVPMSNLPLILPPSLLEHYADVLFFHLGNYSAGTPNPQLYDHTPVNPLTGLGSTTVAEYADPLTGLISVGFAGGIFRNAVGGVFSKSPITETFGGCDGISAAASILQTADVSSLPRRSRVTILACLQCPVRNSDPTDPDQSFEGLFELFPGLSSAALSGLVYAYGYVTLTVTATKGSRIVASNSTAVSLFKLAYRNAPSPPAAYGTAFEKLLDECIFITPPTLNETIELETPLMLRSEADHLICQAEVRIVGVRGGIGDPGAGYIAAKFQDGPPVTPVNLGALGYACPFRVAYLAATHR